MLKGFCLKIKNYLCHELMLLYLDTLFLIHESIFNLLYNQFLTIMQ